MLDSWAALALLQNEPAARRVEEAISKGDAVMSWLNVGEVYYVLTRRAGADKAERGVASLRPVIRIETPSPQLVLSAARIKAHHRVSYADGFVVATAIRHEAPILTGDPEIVALADQVEVIDLRSEG